MYFKKRPDEPYTLGTKSNVIREITKAKAEVITRFLGSAKKQKPINLAEIMKRMA